MDYKEAIEKYEPKDEVENKTKIKMLEYINLYGKSVLSRENEVVHFVSSAWVMNKAKTKVLMVYHKIYNSWMWTGGHADGEGDLLKVAIKEAKEETNIKSLSITSGDIYMMDILSAPEHYRKGKKVLAHAHLSVAYLLEADENELISIQEDENSAVSWIEIDEITKYATRESMCKLGLKLINRMKDLVVGDDNGQLS